MKVYLFIDEFDDSREGICIADNIGEAVKQQAPLAVITSEGAEFLNTIIEKMEPWDYYRVSMIGEYPDTKKEYVITYLVSEYDFEMGKVTWYVK